MAPPDAVLAAARAASARTRTVLVVDDSPEDAEVVRRFLRRAGPGGGGFVVRHVQSALEALAAIHDPAERPDVVLLDHGLPDMSGLEMLDLLGAEPGGSPVPVIMLTGTHAHIDTAVSAMRRGALDYLPKDALSADALRRAIDGAVDRFASARLVAAQRDELERRHRALDAATARTSRLLAIITALGRALTPSEVAAVTLREVMPAAGATTGLVGLVVREPARAGDGAAAGAGDGAGVLETIGAVGLPSATREAWARVPLDADVPFAAAVRAGDPVWVPSTAAARFGALAAAHGVARDEAAATLPLSVDGRVLGLLSLGFPTPRVFGPEDQAFLLTAARQCAQALERAQLYAAAQAARAEAEAANRAKSEFLATMSHELRTPLNAIGGYAELIELGIRGPVTPEQVADLARIQQSQRHLLGLINGVLNYARVEAGAVRYTPSDFALGEVLATCEALVTPQLRAKGLAFTRGGCEGGPGGAPARVHADRDKVQQVVLNLLSNAVKFTLPGGRVVLRCGVEPAGAAPHGVAPNGPTSDGAPPDGEVRGVVRVEVADTGIGIAPEQLERVFEPFVQVDARLTRTQEGTGLGLAISRDLARGMGGDLTAESTTGEGSTFTLTLPAATGER